jgi:inner membrane protein
MALDLLGTQQLALVPIATDNQFQLTSGWPHPSFGGRFLPSTRQVRAQGFDASWRLSALATRAQQQLQNGGDLCSAGGSGRDCLDTVNVDFIDPVDTYVLSDRATKYGVLFIFLTFVAVGLVELLGRVRVHPVQYGLVGAALCSFFLLLLSLSEHLPFELAYAAAGAACVTLLGYYASFILGDWRRGLPFGGLMALMYGLLYVLLRLEQTSLIVGSLALFVVLTVIMVATRQVDWYALVGGPADQDDAPTA